MPGSMSWRPALIAIALLGSTAFPSAAFAQARPAAAPAIPADRFAGRTVHRLFQKDDLIDALQVFIDVFFEVRKSDIAGLHFMDLVDAGGHKGFIAN